MSEAINRGCFCSVSTAHKYNIFLDKLTLEPGKRSAKAGLRPFDLQEDKSSMSDFLINPFSTKEF